MNENYLSHKYLESLNEILTFHAIKVFINKDIWLCDPYNISNPKLK